MKITIFGIIIWLGIRTAFAADVALDRKVSSPKPGKPGRPLIALVETARR